MDYEITKHKIFLNWINTSNRMSISKKSMDEDRKKGFRIVTKSSIPIYILYRERSKIAIK